MQRTWQVARRGTPLPQWTVLDAGRLYASPSLARPPWSAAAQLCAPAGGETVRATPFRRTSREACGTATFFRKVHFHGFAGAGLRDRLRLLLASPGSPARLELAWNRALAGLGLKVPEPVLLAEEGGRRGASALVTRAVPGGVPLHRMEGRRLGGLAGPVAALVAALHGQGLFHRDLYLDHLHLDGTGGLWLADLQRLIRPRLARERWRAKDLAALLHSSMGKVGRLAQARFLAVYGRLMELPEDAVRRLARRVQARQRRMARHRPRHDR